ncbi:MULTISPECIES: carbonate dehydratase [unclassified Pseudomonas]|uniref:carbonate dehydratase n=1 Tax=unclassified Pseudomonas TaxID=196821 RepID=UPI000BCDB0AE|nr:MULTISPECIES: carbonate dehydratase [unclassified Pseudomonas]PVZ15912.1 carbonic anhydrase [Pseudomonas sp. URIL14HWK12:I12]PVZ26232.1 carbonic anhydrase [Pseudomonas sp. URIL14HWK12:I10]PVZ36244.1 carbonic anhydrase [Pseudomonas sp. URIL14HWK12:I11]SNZ18224.1 carbonic anhydrase [Pseudomonas sp. URIL14HWK12:I9]
MHDLQELLDNNARWAESINERDPEFFAKLARQQTPEFLWIGCSDARVPANEIVGMLPGDLFVHRNVANVVLHTDLNCLSVIQYAVDVLKVKHILVTGHYGCGGVRAAMQDQQFGLIDGWLRSIRDLYYVHRHDVAQLPTEEAQVDRMCELNVIQQVSNVAQTTIVQNAWHRGQALSIHGCIYGIKDGRWKSLDTNISGLDQLPQQYRLRPIG